MRTGRTRLHDHRVVASLAQAEEAKGSRGSQRWPAVKGWALAGWARSREVLTRQIFTGIARWRRAIGRKHTAAKL